VQFKSTPILGVLGFGIGEFLDAEQLLGKGQALGSLEARFWGFLEAPAAMQFLVGLDGPLFPLVGPIFWSIFIFGFEGGWRLVFLHSF